MTPVRTIRTVAARELRERAMTKGFLVGTLITVAIIVAAIALPTVLADDGPTEQELGVVGAAPADLEALLDTGVPDAPTITVTEVADRDAAEAALEDEELDAVLLDGRELLADGAPDAALRSALQGALQRAEVQANLGDAGLGEDEAAAALAPGPPLEVVDIAGEDGGSSIAIASIATALLIFTIQGNGMQLLSGALEEKTNRVVEVLVSTARPWQLLTGKLLAMTALALGQLVLVVGAGLATNAAVGAIELPPATGTVLVVSAAMVVFGFLFYGSLFAAAGSMATSLEDSSSAISPLMYLMLAAYGAVFITVIPDPSGPVAQVLTFLPPSAPFAVPARVALGDIAAWQIPVSLLVTLIGTVLVLRLAGRLYAGTLLAGGKMTWKAAFEAEPVR